MFTFRNIWRCKSTIFVFPNYSVFSRNQTPRNTTRDAFMNKYICVWELIFRRFRDVGLGRLCSNSLIASAATTSRNLTPAPRGCKIACKRVLFSTTARRVTSPTWGPHLHVNRPWGHRHELGVVWNKSHLVGMRTQPLIEFTLRAISLWETKDIFNNFFRWL